tara:strand:- start:1512 stop:2081 length:570 start_codon:yes stop_codon:yes gene_type:complete
MIIVGILGDIGSGKSYVAKQFGYPVFNADHEVNKIYKKNKICFRKIKRKLPKYIKSFPISKIELMNAILGNTTNLKKITQIIHPLVRKEMNLFFLKNKKKKIVVLDIPLLLENKLKKKKMVLVFVQSKKSDILRRLTKRKNFNKKILKKFKSIQFPLDYKKNKSQFIIKNDFNKKTVKKQISYILKKVL